MERKEDALGFFEKLAEIERQAEKLAARASLSEIPHFIEGYKRYEVRLDGVVVGRVENVRETVERKPKGLRYVTARRTRKSWSYHSSDVAFSTSFPLPTRKRALQGLFEHLIRHGNLPEKERD